MAMQSVDTRTHSGPHTYSRPRPGSAWPHTARSADRRGYSVNGKLPPLLVDVDWRGEVVLITRQRAARFADPDNALVYVDKLNDVTASRMRPSVIRHVSRWFCSAVRSIVLRTCTLADTQGGVL